MFDNEGLAPLVGPSLLRATVGHPHDDRLGRALERSPDIADTGEWFNLSDSEVHAEGSSAVWENVGAVNDRSAQRSDHVMRFLQSELGTSGGIDNRQRARFTGGVR